MNPFSRTQFLLGSDAMEKLKNARVAVFGLGGVGGYVVEALARSGIGALDLIDHDTISLTNINRQILATHSTVGMPKVEAARARILDINPACCVHPIIGRYEQSNRDAFFGDYDYIVDAIDTVSAKLALIEGANKAKTPIISCMGTGNKIDPTAFQISDIYKTSVCPLAKVMRRELKARGIKKLKVLWSPEEPKKVSVPGEEHRRGVPASCSFVPPVAGYILAGEVIKDILGEN